MFDAWSFLQDKDLGVVATSDKEPRFWFGLSSPVAMRNTSHYHAVKTV